MSTYTQIIYHMVFSTKNRERTLAADKREDVYKYIWGILKNRKSHLYRIGGTEDHVHILSSLHLTQGTQVRVTSLVANFLDFPTSFVYALSMVRPWRVEFESAVYHVMCRGEAFGVKPATVSLVARRARERMAESKSVGIADFGCCPSAREFGIHNAESKI